MEYQKTVRISGDARAGFQVAKRILQSRGFSVAVEQDDYVSFDGLASSVDDTVWLLAASKITIACGEAGNELSVQAQYRGYRRLRGLFFACLVYLIALLAAVGVATWLSVELGNVEGYPVLGMMILLLGLQLPLPFLMVYFGRKTRRALDFLVAAMTAGIEQEIEGTAPAMAAREQRG